MLGCSSDDSSGNAAGAGGAAGNDPVSFAGSSNGPGNGLAAGAGGLPNGGREYETIVNLVDPEAVRQIEEVCSRRLDGGYTLAAQAFYALYPDEYDFLYFILDHSFQSPTAAAFQPVNRPAIPGTGIEDPSALLGYGTRGRLKGAAAFQSDRDSGMLAFAHETAHYWANELDPALGFGRELDVDDGTHWASRASTGSSAHSIPRLCAARTPRARRRRAAGPKPTAAPATRPAHSRRTPTCSRACRTRPSSFI